MHNSNDHELIQKLQLKIQRLEKQNAYCEKLRIELIDKLMASQDKERRSKNKSRQLKRRLK
jgi:hypothetical protein